MGKKGASKRLGNVKSTSRIEADKQRQDVAPRVGKAQQARREATEIKIKNTVWDILITEGFTTLGVNDISRRAGVSKELIYRYFGDLPSLVVATIGDRDYWLQDRMAALAASSADLTPRELARSIITDHARSLLSDRNMREIRLWEFVARHPAAASLAERREAVGRLISNILTSKAGPDAAAVLGLITAGLSYLILRSDQLTTYFGIDLRSEAGWEKWLETAELVVDSIVKDE